MRVTKNKFRQRKLIITQQQIDTMAENLASELNLRSYNHLALVESISRLISELIKDATKYPSRYFETANLLEHIKAIADKDNKITEE